MLLLLLLQSLGSTSTFSIQFLEQLEQLFSVVVEKQLLGPRSRSRSSLTRLRIRGNAPTSSALLTRRSRRAKGDGRRHDRYR